MASVSLSRKLFIIGQPTLLFGYWQAVSVRRSATLHERAPIRKHELNAPAPPNFPTDRRSCSPASPKTIQRQIRRAARTRFRSATVTGALFPVKRQIVD